MSVRTWSIRSRLVALVAVPIVCLVLFWGFANYLTLGDGLRLYNQSRLVDELTVPMDNVVIALQAERRAGMVYLADPGGTKQRQLSEARRDADHAVATFRSKVASGSVRSVATDRMLSLAQDELTDLSGLTDLRGKVDHRSLSPTELMSGTAALIDGVDPLYAQVTTFPDDETGAEGRAVAMLSRAREMRSRTDAVLAYALAKGHFGAESYRLFLKSVGAEEDQYEAAAAALPAADLRRYDALLAKAPFGELTAMRQAAVDKGGPDTGVPVNAVQWRQANAHALTAQYRFEQHLYQLLGEHAKAPSYVIFLRLGLAGLLGLIAIVISVLVARRLTRALIRQLRTLRDSARDLAWVRLPAVVQRLSDGQSVDVAAEVPRLPAGSDEIGQVAEAFNEVGRTAVQAASGQAELRTGAASMFLNIARRSQTLLHRQLGQLDVMERKAAEPEALDDLFKVDHLATRMRRNAENLVILGGGVPGRVWSEPKPLLDVLRSAASEVEQYERVHVLPFPTTLLAGSVISDVVHLVAELIDNATAFSPPHTRVNVTGQPVPKGFAIEIEDRGLGMSAADIDSVNEWLAHPPSVDVLARGGDARLGMFVVARLGTRHDIGVQLRPSPYGGTTAIVLLPAELVERVEEEPPERPTADRPIADRPAPVLVAAGSRRAVAGTDPGRRTGPARVSTLGPARPAHAEPEPPAPETPMPDPAKSGRSAPVASVPAVSAADSSALDDSAADSSALDGSAVDSSALESFGPAPTAPVASVSDGSIAAPTAPVTSAAAPDAAISPDVAVPADVTGSAAEANASASPDDELDGGLDGGVVTVRLSSPAPTEVGTPAEADPAPPPPAGDGAADRPVEVVRPEPDGPEGDDAGVERAEVPAAGAAADPVPSDVDDADTHLGLPRRVRQASLAPGLREEPAAGAAEPVAGPGRSPEEIRQMMSSYQQGTVRGRGEPAGPPAIPAQPGGGVVGSGPDTGVADSGREDG